MKSTQKQIGPLTYGTVLGACVGLAIFLFGLVAIGNDDTQRSYESLLVVALGGAGVGCLLGFFAESLLHHPQIASRTWARYVIRVWSKNSAEH